MPGKLKPIPKGKENSLAWLLTKWVLQRQKVNPKLVQEQMGFAKRGGAIKMKHGGSTCKGMGAAVRGGNFTRNG